MQNNSLFGIIFKHVKSFMIPVSAVDMHIRDPLAFVMETEPFDQIQRRFILRKNKSLYPVHPVLIENKGHGTFQGFRHVSFARMILIEMISAGTGHHSAESKIKERYPSYYLPCLLQADPQRDKAAFQK